MIVAYLTRDVSGTDGVGPRVWWRNGAVIARVQHRRGKMAIVHLEGKFEKSGMFNDAAFDFSKACPLNKDLSSK